MLSKLTDVEGASKEHNLQYEIIRRVATPGINIMNEKEQRTVKWHDKQHNDKKTNQNT
jgi:hypothetical protein